MIIAIKTIEFKNFFRGVNLEVLYEYIHIKYSEIV